MGMNEKFHWLQVKSTCVILFAAAMAWVEAAVVLYLRVFIDRVQPYQLDPLPTSVGLGKAELLREAATILMLGCVGWLAGRDRRERMGYALLAFGTWDILYYAFLVPLSGWPASLLDWDILFLIPVPWWAPVLAPLSVAALMVFTGAAIAQFHLWPRRSAWLMSLCGAALALYTFMVDALRVLGHGPHAVWEVLPISFHWPIFLFALLFMAAPLIDMFWSLRSAPPSGTQLEGRGRALLSDSYR
jgi:hypothetical protein